MDDLHRLYEHQTMMAIGIYSFLDNLLAHIPSRTDSETIDNRAPRFRPGVSELAEGLAGISRADTFRERQERIRLPPRLSTLTVSDGIFRGVDPVEAGVEPTTEDISPSDPIEPASKAEVTPGGYPEELFIYLSEREKEEYMCAVCYSVLKEAYQCPNEHRFCYGCIYTWSTGPSTGHDGCPVCRCDGLYAKNFDVSHFAYTTESLNVFGIPRLFFHRKTRMMRLYKHSTPYGHAFTSEIGMYNSIFMFPNNPNGCSIPLYVNCPNFMYSLIRFNNLVKISRYQQK
ncbi:hypothetical protein P879_10692 [Paragonimus westermani]|uniref:RING-type domain-containing protein n=1 Tax=Paragonimus westermani TaxID=34504 RepID=A0A8T0DBA9_9TREM|nr:hypothetical protein P879_10692 [Paragonimus westermani]